MVALLVAVVRLLDTRLVAGGEIVSVCVCLVVLRGWYGINTHGAVERSFRTRPVEYIDDSFSFRFSSHSSCWCCALLHIHPLVFSQHARECFEYFEGWREKQPKSKDRNSARQVLSQRWHLLISHQVEITFRGGNLSKNHKKKINSWWEMMETSSMP